MIVLLSPAKTLDYTKEFDVEPSAPAFLSDSAKLIKELKTKEPKDIASLMGLSDKLATLNFDRYQSWSAAKKMSADSKPALFVFQGDVYQGLQADTFNKKDISFAQKHLRIHHFSFQENSAFLEQGRDILGTECAAELLS